jgi:WhiB family redox-sensing transcriptional regulator
MADRTNFHAMFQAVGGDGWDYSAADNDERHLRQGWAPTVATGAHLLDDAMSGYEHPGWMEQAGCAGQDVNFFVTDHDVPRLVKRICRRCPVAEECFEYAIGDHALVGYWGGTSRSERERIWAARDEVSA